MKSKNLEHIAAGQIVSGKDQSTVYQAHLGTCLGVALYDKSTHTGGLIHILLPEPPGFSLPENPEKYASTGIPILINQLTALGVYTRNLEATIAGGALVGPVSRQDMNLDIGGRSFETAQSILQAYEIKIIRSETGGFFSCTLELDMETGKAQIKPAYKDMTLSKEKIPLPSLVDISKTIDRLKPVPQTALKIFRMHCSGQSSLKEMTDELSRDQVLSAQTLKLCNCAIFSGRNKIDTLKDAVLLLGEDMLIRSLITAAMNDYYSQADVSGYSLCKGGLFFHAVGVAALSDIIARKCDSPYKKTAYTAGLLHDIGKVVLDQYVADRIPMLFRRMIQKQDNFIEAEKKTIGITHSETGAILAKNWNFSNELTMAIRFHHTPEKTKTSKELTYIVYLADLIIEKFLTGFEHEKIQTDSLEKALDKTGLKKKDLPELIDMIPVNDIQTINRYTTKR